MNKKVVFTEEQIKNIIEYYQYPHSLNDTTKFAGITKSKIIHDLLIAHNIPLHNKALAKQLQWNKQQEYFKEVSGKTLVALSNDMNLKEQITKDYIINISKNEEIKKEENNNEEKKDNNVVVINENRKKQIIIGVTSFIVIVICIILIVIINIKKSIKKRAAQWK